MSKGTVESLKMCSMRQQEKNSKESEREFKMLNCVNVNSIVSS